MITQGMRKPAQHSISEKLARYGVMSAAALAAAAPAQAGIVYYDPADVTTPASNHSSIFFSMTNAFPPINTLMSYGPGFYGGTPADFWLHHHTSGSAMMRIGSANTNNQIMVQRYTGITYYGGPTSWRRPQRLNAGDAIGPAGYWGGGSNALGWGGSGYVGVRFYIGADIRYGWVNITINPDYTSTLHRWAYEDTGGQILAGDTASGAIPEPASIVLMALGAAGLALYRKRRKAA